MPAIAATAPGKIILFGEHAVVYGQPAIAVPVIQVQVRAVVTPAIKAPTGQIEISAPDIQLHGVLKELPFDHALNQAIQLTLKELGLSTHPAFNLKISSSIPLAAGLGSGAAVSVAVIRSVSKFLGRPMADERVNALTYEIEKIHHGTPSGIDNTVITYEKPVFFIREQVIQTVNVKTPFTLVIGDTGIPSPTAITVGDVRKYWQADPEKYETLFNACGEIANDAHAAIENGAVDKLGPLMNENQQRLVEMGVSSPELNILIDAATVAGAWGAKLSGGGRGGNMIALIGPEQASHVAEALKTAGATNTIITKVSHV